MKLSEVFHFVLYPGCARSAENLGNDTKFGNRVGGAEPEKRGNLLRIDSGPARRRLHTVRNSAAWCATIWD